MINWNLDGFDLSTFNLTNVESEGITGSPVLPNNWKLANGYLVGPTANLNYANLSGVDLAGSDLAGANLANANLSGADLSSTNLKGANLQYANLSSAVVTGVVTNKATICLGGSHGPCVAW